MAVPARSKLGLVGLRANRNSLVNIPSKFIPPTRLLAVARQPHQTFRDDADGRRKQNQSSSLELDDASGIWQSSDGLMSWLDPASNDIDELEDGPHRLRGDDDPALDYVLRYPPPTDDDPDSPSFAAAAAAAALAGPDMHAALEVEIEAELGMVAGRASRGPLGARSLMEQLRQRALSDSSDEEENERWRSMDIPALLLSPHHASALHSLSSSDDDTSRVPDFADLTLAHEAELAAREAAAQVPPELQPLVRAANLLDFHTQQGRGRGPWGRGTSAGEPEPPPHLPANRFEGFLEPLTAEQLETAAALIAQNIPTAAAQARFGRAGGGPVRGDALVAEVTNDCNSIAGSSGAEDAVPAGYDSAGRAGSSVVSDTSEDEDVRAALAVVAEEEGVEWLSAGRLAPAASAAIGVATTAAAARAPALPAATSEQPPGQGKATQQEAAEEVRSVQLRRAPRIAGAEGGMDPVVRSRIAEEVARDVREADAHVVRSAAAPTGSGAGAGRFVLPRSASLGPSGAGEDAVAAAAVVEGRVASGGEAAADMAAASLAAEIRTAVWGEGGWPYDPALRSSDIVDELKHSIEELKDEAEHGSSSTLLP